MCVSDVIYIICIAVVLADIIRPTIRQFMCNPIDLPMCDKFNGSRFSRAIRPLFLVHHLRYAQNDLHKLWVSFVHVQNVLHFLLATMVVFGIYGYVNFSHCEWESTGFSFDSYQHTTVALFTLMTTEGYEIVHSTYSCAPLTSFVYYLLWTVSSIFILATFLGSIHNSYKNERLVQVSKQLEQEALNLTAAFHSLTFQGLKTINLVKWLELMRMVETRLSAEEAKRIFLLVDADRNGAIDLNEFTMACDVMRSKKSSKIFKSAIRFFRTIYRWLCCITSKRKKENGIERWGRYYTAAWHPMAESIRVIVVIANICVMVYLKRESVKTKYFIADSVFAILGIMDVIFQMYGRGLDEYFSKWHKVVWTFFIIMSGPVAFIVGSPNYFSTPFDPDIFRNDLNLRLLRSCNLILSLAALSESMKNKFLTKSHKEYVKHMDMSSYFRGGMHTILDANEDPVVLSGFTVFSAQIAYLLDYEQVVQAFIRLSGVIFRMVIVTFIVIYPFAIVGMHLFEREIIQCDSSNSAEPWQDCDDFTVKWNFDHWNNAMKLLYQGFYTADVSTFLLATQGVDFHIATIYWLSFNFFMSIVIMNTILSNIIEHYQVEQDSSGEALAMIQDLDLYLEKKSAEQMNDLNQRMSEYTEIRQRAISKYETEINRRRPSRLEINISPG